ncbi:AfaD family invasin [Serratia sp. N21D137]|uniref:AfaD family invasin n=1 Tax=Serratia sp. N21D137 TaxID=3397495 RepID=UPI0039E02CA0
MTELNLQMDSGKIAGFIPGNTKIGKGNIASNEEHIGFQVWSDASRIDTRPNSYIIKGKGENTNNLRVRIENESWVPFNKDQGGIITKTKENNSNFYIITDGDQYIISDSYTLELKGKLLF